MRSPLESLELVVGETGSEHRFMTRSIKNGHDSVEFRLRQAGGALGILEFAQPADASVDSAGGLPNTEALELAKLPDDQAVVF